MDTLRLATAPMSKSIVAKELESLYYKINCDLTVDIAKKAKNENVKQFIFLSTMAIYGNKITEINKNTVPEPDNFYGKSKLKAEKEIQTLKDDNFKLCIVRPPIVYGKGCKGNFPKLVRFAKLTPIFPDYPNKRSMVFIDNLNIHICKMVENVQSGLFFPQDDFYMNITEIIRYVSLLCGKKLITTKFFNPIIIKLVNNSNLFKKIFGDLYYDFYEDDSENELFPFEESIKKSVLDYL
jgi:UDP-glucose 4-epimerase